MPETKSNAELIRIADDVFRRYMLNLWGSPDKIQCVTCQEFFSPEEITVGHIMSRRYYATRWLAINVLPQCHQCNSFKDGNGIQQKVTPENLRTVQQLANDPSFRLDNNHIMEVIDQYEREA